MKKIGKKRNKSVVIDIVVIAFVLLFAGFLYNNYFQYSKSVALDPNYIKGAPDINNMLLQQIQNTPLDPDFLSTKPINILKTFSFKTANLISQVPMIDSIYHFVNKNQGFVHECSSDGEYVDSTIPQIRYPLDITKKELQQKIKDYPELLIVDVRNVDNYLKGHIPCSVTMPLLDLINQIYIVNRWTEIVVAGDSYLQTKLASEALLRLNFQRLHRLIVPIEKWCKQLESFQ
jgi:rhodanese-related sulfurtransferase